MDLEHDEITDLQVSEHSKKLGLLATQLGYEGALTVGALEDEIRFYQMRSVEAVLELGKRLIILKEMTAHGEFSQRIEMLGIDSSLARKFMSAVMKFSKRETSPVLKSIKTQSKLLEMLVLDDDAIDVIEQGGSIGDVNLDSIETMSVRELKKALREAKADAEAKDSIIRKKDETINKLDTELSVLNSPMEIKLREQSEQQKHETAVLEAISTATLTLHNNVVRFTNEVNAVLAAIQEHDLHSVEDRVVQDIVAAFQQIAQTSVDLGIQIDFTDMVTPSWMHSSQTLADALAPETTTEQ